MKKVIDNSSVPKGGTWVYVHEESGFILKHPYYNQVLSNVKEFFKANNYPITANFADEVEQNLCDHAAEGVCMDWVPPSLTDKLSNLTRAISKAALTWRQPVVTAEELERRRGICQSCNFYNGSTSLLKIACRHCGCAGLKLALSSTHCPLPQPKW